MRHTELETRLSEALGDDYAAFWASQTVIAALDGRTPRQALDDGVPPKQVWAAVWETLGLPASQR
ncbi:hypothetical protein GCM10009737_32060 [Nocardioides lentus]|uniref:DUF3046 domain-containing protein n=1 Tax=Nocardioides lentus TaxID=338077 RepID=A0ABP5B0E8_9ACTN